MGKLVFFAICVTSALLFPSTNGEDTSSYIVGGEDATVEEHPYMAGVFVFGFPMCTGAIISPRSVLTAAHCILPSIPNSASVSVGSSRRSGEGGVTHRSFRVHIHPDYYGTREPFLIQADLAIIQTFTRIQFRATVQPIEISFNIVPPASQVVAIGWGLTGDSFIHDRADLLQRVNMTSIPNPLCAMIFSDRAHAVTEEKICVFNTNNGGVGGGDSGGPLLFQGRVVGVACWTRRPFGSHPSVYIRTSSHANWIRQYI